jgi:RNA polymerase sigma factor (sigma-70 family)
MPSFEGQLAARQPWKEMRNRQTCRTPQPQQQITDEDLHDRYHRLIYKVAWTMKRIPQYHLTDEDVHDIAQAALVRLIGMSQTQRNYPAVYHRTVINNACRTALDRILRHTDHITSYHNEMRESPSTYQDVFHDPRQDLEDPTINKLTVEHCLNALDSLARQIVILACGLYGQSPHTPHKIARKLGLPRQTVEQTIQNSIHLMRKVI